MSTPCPKQSSHNPHSWTGQSGSPVWCEGVRGDPGKHWAIPTQDQTVQHEGERAAQCEICRDFVRKHIRNQAARTPDGSRLLQVGDRFRLKPEHSWSTDPGWMTIADIRYNSFTGEIWIHPFEAGNLVVKAEYIAEVEEWA